MPSGTPDSIKPYLDEIAQCLFSGNATVMVGAGFSRNAEPVSSASAPFPSWQELGDHFFKKLCGKYPSQSESRYLSVLKLAEQVEVKFGRCMLNKLLRDAIPDLKYEPSPLHNKLLNLPWKDVFTTNYDTLLERARMSVILENYSVVAKEEDLLHQNQPRIVKLHGSFPSPPFIITEEDYRRYPNDHAPFVNTVRQSLLENTLCLIGFSGDDPNFLEWIGWIRDHLEKESTSPIYLIEVPKNPVETDRHLVEANRRLLEHRGIIVVDLSVFNADPKSALDEFLDNLQQSCQEHKDHILNWPKIPDNAEQWLLHGNPEKYPEIAAEWRRQREEYPGWVIVPEDRREKLWRYTEHWLSNLPEISSADHTRLETTLDLDLVFELAWRLDRCLVPLIGELPSSLEEIANKYSAPTLTLPETSHWTKASVFEAVANIRLWLLRHYREAGLAEKWQEVKNAMINKDFRRLPSELKAKFQIEEALQALFHFDLAEAKRLLVDDWQSNDSLPFWEAKRAALMAELGESAVAHPILKVSLSAIREQLSQNPVTDNYTLVSQESVVMLLLWAVKRGGNSNLFSEMSERWNRLAQYKCDPRREIELLSADLQHPAGKWQTENKIHRFDLGRVTKTFRFDRSDEKMKEVLAAYNTLRMYEDIGMPYRIEYTRFFTQVIESTLPRVRPYSPHWALVNIVRLGEAEATDGLFDREYLADLTHDEVDRLFETYLPAFERTISMINDSDSLEAKTFKSLARILPEVFSRLCYKCSPEYQNKLVQLLVAIYGLNPERRRMFTEQVSTEICRFTYRLLNSMSFQDRLKMPLIIESPVLDNLRNIFVNPLIWINRTELPPGEDLDLEIQKIEVDKLLNELEFPELSEQKRDWTKTFLVWLYQWDKLNQQQSKRLGNVLWHDVESPNVPVVTGYYKFKCIQLPYPKDKDIDPQQRAKEDLQARIQKQMADSRADRILKELYNSAELVSWSKTEALKFVQQFSQWWCQHKYLLSDCDPGPFGSPAKNTKRTITNAVHALSEVFAHLPENPEEDIEPLRKFLANLAEHNIPTKVLDVAILSEVPQARQEVLEQVRKALLNNDRDVVVDALRAVLVLARNEEEAIDEFTPIATMLVQGVQWGHRPALADRLLVVTDLVKKRSRFLLPEESIKREEVLTSLCDGLEKIAEETSDGIRGNDEDGVITVRANAATLAFALSKYCQEFGLDEPEAIQCWCDLCRGPKEFAEVRNSWPITGS